MQPGASRAEPFEGVPHGGRRARHQGALRGFKTVFRSVFRFRFCIYIVVPGSGFTFFYLLYFSVVKIISKWKTLTRFQALSFL